MKTSQDILDMLENNPSCTVSPKVDDVAVLVTCGQCYTTVPLGDPSLSTTDLHAIEKDLELCLGKRWLE